MIPPPVHQCLLLGISNHHYSFPPADANERVPAGLYQWADEREHDRLVWGHADPGEENGVTLLAAGYMPAALLILV